MRQEVKIPTLLALFILIVGLGSLLYLIENIWSFYVWSNSSTNPKNVSISNVTDTSLTVSWMTDQPTTGIVTYQERGLLTPRFLAVDDRDINGIKHDYQIHFVTLRGLKSNVDYEIEIISGKTKQKFSAATGPTINTSQAAVIPVYGKLSFNPLFTQEILIHANLVGSQTLSTLVNKDGSWVLPLGHLRTQDLSRMHQVSTNDVLTLNFISPQKTSQVVTKVSYATPLPTINLGENYDFTTKTILPNGLVVAVDKATNKNLALVNSSFSITLPKSNSRIPSYRPQFKGTGIPGKSVYITIKSGSLVSSGKTQVNNAGTWSFSPKTDLPAGQTLAVITSYDQNNTAIAKSVSFNILKSGTSVLGEATPSASLNPSPTSSPQTSVSPSPTPKSSIAPSLLPTPTVSATASPITTPVAGNPDLTLGIVMLGLAFFILGGVIIFTKI